jgi:hypothetical protein
VVKRCADTFAFNVNAILRISAKAYKSLFRTMSLLKLVSKIQEVIANGKLPVSQSYLFDASPDFFNIFGEIKFFY